MTCTMCDNPKWTWYEVLGADCGICEPHESVAKLCDVHQQIFMEQFDAIKPKTEPKLLKIILRKPTWVEQNEMDKLNNQHQSE